jgi:4-diphosphocytidyl-2-C-methyl-D-erythritol kinase
LSRARSSRTIALPARAKLNLDLQVVGRRADGLHELRSRMQAIELHDLLMASKAESTSLAVSGIEVAETAANSVLKAHAAVEAAAGRELPTSYALHKRIPPGSGMGGASSDAAAAMRALAELHDLQLELAPVATRVGADVTFFLAGGAAQVQGVGDLVRPVETIELWFAIAWPGIELSTAAVYAAWDRLGASSNNEPNQLRGAAASVEPRIDRFAEHLGQGWQMTGSGSAFFLPCADRGSAEAAVEKLDCWTAVSSAVGPWA